MVLNNNYSDMLSLILVKKIASLFIIMALGFAAVRLRVLKAEDSKVLSKISIYVITPCMILNSFQVERDEGVLFNFLISLAVAAIIHLAFIVIGTLLKKPLKLSAVEEASIEYPNAGNLVIPLVIAMFGNDMVVYTLPFITVTSFLIWTHMVYIMSGGKLSAKMILLNINLISIVVSFLMFVTNIRFPSVIKDAFQMCTDLIGPISMLITGMLLGGQNLRQIFGNKRAYMVMLLRLIIFPLLALAFYKLARVDTWTRGGETVILISFLATCSASASTVVSLSQVYNLDADHASTINLLTSVFCIVTIPLLIMLYQAI